MEETRPEVTSHGSERAVLLGVCGADGPVRAEHDLDELEKLSESAGLVVVGRVTQRRKRLDPGYYVGRGKAVEIGELAESREADVVVCDEDLSPGQVRNL